MNRAARVLLINYEYPPIGGGAGTATAGMARALAQLGCDVLVLTSRFRGQLRDEITDGFRIRRVRVVRRRADRCTPAEMVTFIISATAEVVRLSAGWKPDVAIAYFGIPGGPVAWTLRRLRGVPYIISLRGGDVPGFVWRPGAERYHRVTALFVRYLWRHARAVVANGSGLQQLAEQAMPGLNVPVIPNGVDAQRHAPGDVPTSGNEPPSLLLVGRLVHQKGVDVLLDALAQIRHLPFTLHVAGEGPDRESLTAHAMRNGLSERVVFDGWVDRSELPALYRKAAVFVLPSRIEGMPNVVLEAMAYALPVIATDVAGTRDLVRDGTTGLLVPPDDIEALANALTTLITSSAERDRLGRNARRHVLANHTWEASARAYLDLALPRELISAEAG